MSHSTWIPQIKKRIADGQLDEPRWPRIKLLSESDPEEVNRGVPTKPLSIPRAMTAGQRRRFLRDCLIHLGYNRGMSHRQIAEAFGLPRSRVGAILKAPPRVVHSGGQ